MFQGVRNAWQLIASSFEVFRRHPQLLFPLLFAWVLFAPTLLYFTYIFQWDAYEGDVILGVLFGLIFSFPLLLAWSCSMLLELIQQLESGQDLNIWQAFVHTWKQNMLKILPIVIVWASVSFLILLVVYLFSGDDDNNSGDSSLEDSAKTLSGYSDSSFSSDLIDMFFKGSRMVVFVMLPAIAWENMGTWQSVKKGVRICRAHLLEFASGFMMTEGVGFILALFPFILFFISEQLGYVFPSWIWVLVIMYSAFMWSYLLYLEQMFTAELYMWNLIWEKEVEIARSEGRDEPTLAMISYPSILNTVDDILR